MITVSDINNLFDNQLLTWQLAHDNYAALDNLQVRSMCAGKCEFITQFNPQRATSVTASLVKNTERPCFLCSHNLPHEQEHLSLWDRYRILVNPYPLFNHHYTVAATVHTPQRIKGRVQDMLLIAQSFAPYTVFYNGPYSGASAPMHMHFQIVNHGYMPIEKQWHEADKCTIHASDDCNVSLLEGMYRPIIVIEGNCVRAIENQFDKVYEALTRLSVNTSCEEPMFNAMARHEHDQYILLVFPRAKHRPNFYYATGSNQLLISPGSVEMGGIFVTIRQEDYIALTPEIIKKIYSEVTPSQDEIKQVLLHI